MKRIALILTLSLLATMSVAAQEKPKQEAPKTDPAKTAAKPAAGTPTVDEILDRYVKTIGGKEAVQKHTSRAIKGSFDIEAMNLSGTMELFMKAPNKSAAIVVLPGVGNFNEVFDGEKGWAADPMQGLREKGGAELAATKRRSDFYTEINYKKHYTKLEVKGKEKVGSSEAYVIEGTPAEGAPEKLYFDVNTGLLVRHDFEAETPQGKMNTESYFEDYKEVDGVKMAHTMKQVNPMFSMTMKFTEVKNNVPIDDAKFAKPSGQ